MPTKKTSNLNQILPQLDNCNMIANHWARELLTIFEHTCIKEWRENSSKRASQHLKVRPKDALFVAHLRILERKKNSGYSLIISSSKDILSHKAETYAPDTLILIGSSTTDKCTLVWWNEKDDAKPLFSIKKNSGNGFILVTEYGERLMQYGKNDNTGRLKRFLNDSLAYQCLDKTRSKGARNSNQNSATQSVRKLGKPIAGATVIMEWKNRIEQKTMLGAYEIVSGEYGYEKSYRTFVRNLKKLNASVIEFKKDGDLLEISLM